MFIEAERRPRIRTEIETPPTRLTDGRVFLRIFVINEALGWPWRAFMDRRPALMTRAWITFLTERNASFFRPGRRMRGRWSSTPEPIRPLPISPSSAGGPSLALLWDLSITRDHVDIAPGSREILDIVMRAQGEDGCRGWHNGIIQRPDPPEDEQFELPAGRYRALVRVQTAGRTYRALFNTVNDVPIGDFRLEPVRMDSSLPDDL